jgi:hypothetical protein
MKHEGRVIPKEEVLANRSNAYEFIDFNNCKDCNKSLEDCTCINDTLDMKQETLEELIMKKLFIKYKKPIVIIIGIITLNLYFGFDARFTIINLLWLLL